LNDITDGVCHYPDDQCLTKFKQDEVILLPNNNELIINICPEHIELYTVICKCDHIYCDKCAIQCGCGVYNNIGNIEQWKKYTLSQMKNFADTLNNKIKGLECITEIIINNNSVNNVEYITKQIEDIIDTVFVDISHVDNFINHINDNIPISNIIKRKNIILNNKIPISSINIIPSAWPRKHVLDIIDIIIKNDGDINANDNNALTYAYINGNLDIVKCLISHGKYTGGSCNVPFIWASYKGHLDIVEFLLSHDADIHANNDHALRTAASSGHLTVVEYLVEHGANVHACNNEALNVASNNGYLAIVELLNQEWS
jgi:ankyrin repeat protein